MKWKFGRSKGAGASTEYPFFPQTQPLSPSARPICIPRFPSQETELPPTPELPSPVKASPPPRYNPRWIFSRLTGRLSPQGDRPGNHLDFHDIEQTLKDDAQRCVKRAATHEEIEAGEYQWNQNANIFRAPLNDVMEYASISTDVEGYHHDIPVLVFHCVDTLEKRGLYHPNLFTSLNVNSDRHQSLQNKYNTAPHYGRNVRIDREEIPNVCCLLESYLRQLPEPIIHHSIFNALWFWCAEPSATISQENRSGTKRDSSSINRRPWDAKEFPGEENLITIAQYLLRLLPQANLSMLIYLSAFFTQLPNHFENGIQLDDVARIFGRTFCGRDAPKWQTKDIVLWILSRWHLISKDLFQPAHNSRLVSGSNMASRLSNPSGVHDHGTSQLDSRSQFQPRPILRQSTSSYRHVSRGINITRFDLPPPSSSTSSTSTGVTECKPNFSNRSSFLPPSTSISSSSTGTGVTESNSGFSDYSFSRRCGEEEDSDVESAYDLCEYNDEDDDSDSHKTKSEILFERTRYMSN